MTNYRPNSSELFTTVHFLEIYIVHRNNNLYENSLEFKRTTHILYD